jgi:hypothetical protein
MQTTTSKNVRKDGRPFAATTSAPRANGNAKIVWEKRISRRKRPTGPPPTRLINGIFTEGSEGNEDSNFDWIQARSVPSVSFC